MVGPEGMMRAIEALPLRRIGHGVRAIEDRRVMDLLVEKNIALEVCPTSNIELKVFPDYLSHPLRKLQAHGIKITLNSDDPPFFKTDLGKEYSVAREHFGYSDHELLDITRTAIDVSFADESTKARLRERLVLG